MSGDAMPTVENDARLGLNLPRPERIPADCCADHNAMCWYDACCGKCSELERCRARLGQGVDAPRCILPVSQHADPRSTVATDHEWDRTYPPGQQADQ